MRHTKAVRSNGIERQWLTRVKEAQAQYRQALEHQERTIEELNKVLSDPVDAIAQANGAARLALDDLVERQGVLVDLVLNMSPGAERS